MDYTEKDESRIFEIKSDSSLEEEPYRTQWSRDYARLIHSPSYRRLQGKTQLFPGQESDFFRNRLTHSQEVAQISKSIAIRLNHLLKKNNQDYVIDPTLVEFAGLAHDLGHPPFGHLGERALNKKMIYFGGFEANAQTLRILTKLEKKHKIDGTKEDSGIDAKGIDKRVGLNLTFRSLASILKYDNKIQYRGKDIDKLKPIKGYYESEENIVKTIKDKVTGVDNYKGKFKTIECQIMDIADDIAYSTYDLEDAFKLGFLEPLDLIPTEYNDKIIENVTKKINRNLNLALKVNDIKDTILKIMRKYFLDYPFEIGSDVPLSDTEKIDLFLISVGVAKNISKDIASKGYLRSPFTSSLVGRFIRGVEIGEINKKIPALSTIDIKSDVRKEIEVLKNFTYETLILSPKVKIAEYRGDKIVSEIFDVLSDNKGFELLPPDIRTIYDSVKREEDKKRVISDFIASMTDNFALEFYSRLKTVNPQTIFKPL